MPARLTLGVALCLLASLLLAREESRGVFSQLEEGWVSWLLANSPGAITDPEVTFIQLDDTEDRIFESWPLSPGDHALVLQNLRQFEPKLVGISPSLRWEDKGMLFGSLITQLEALPTTILGTELSYIEAEDGFVDPTIANLFEALPQVVGDATKIPPITTVLDLPQDQIRSGRSLGFTKLDSFGTEDSSIEGLRVPLLARYGKTVIPAFTLRLSMAHLQIEPEDVRVSLGRWIRLGDRQIPIDHTGAMAVDPKLRSSVPRLNASALLFGSDLESMALNEDETRALGSLRTNAVVIGNDDPPSRTISLVSGESISHADLLTTALATIQGKRHIRELELPGRIVLWVLALLVASALFAVPRGRSVRFGLLGALAFAVVGLLAFQVLKVWASPVVPLGTLLVGLLGAGLTTENLKKMTDEDEQD